jgi:hypothetical protein
MVSSIRGWLRLERRPRLTIVSLLAISTSVAVFIGWLLAIWGVDGWGTRAFFAVLATWPIFVGLVSWRASVEFGQMHLRSKDREDRFIAMDGRIEHHLARDDADHEISEIERALYREMGSNLLTLLLLGALTLGSWLIWDLIRTGATLLAETILDAEVVPSRRDLLNSISHLDWRTEAFGLTAAYFGGLAFAAGTIGHVLRYFVS